MRRSNKEGEEEESAENSAVDGPVGGKTAEQAVTDVVVVAPPLDRHLWQKGSYSAATTIGRVIGQGRKGKTLSSRL